MVGDWNGDGLDSPGVFRNGTWFLSNSCGGTGDYVFGFGNSNDIPVVGDWDGNGTDTPGVFRNGVWYLSNGFSGQVNHSFGYGNWNDKPVVGDWDGNGTDTPGVFQGAAWALSNGFSGQVNHSFVFGISTDVPVVGDWDGNGSDTPGIVRGAQWTVSNVFGGTGNRTFNYGAAGDTFVAGDWNGGGGPDTPGIARPGDLPQWQQRWLDEFDGTGNPNKWEIQGGTNAEKAGGSVRVDPGDSIWTLDEFAYPAGTRVRVSARILLPNTGTSYASLWVQQPPATAPGGEPRELDIIESYGPQKNRAQIASHPVYPHEHPNSLCWIQPVHTYFPTASKPWSAEYLYEAEWVVGGDTVVFRAKSLSGALRYEVAAPVGAIRVPGDSGFRIRLSNKIAPNPVSGGTRSGMRVDWVTVQTKGA